jgi:hypothetical protein
MDAEAPAPDTMAALLDAVYNTVDEENDGDAADDQGSNTESEDDDHDDPHVCDAWSAGFVFGVRGSEPLAIENELVEAAAMPAAPIANMEAEDDDAARMQIDSEGVETEQKVLE